MKVLVRIRQYGGREPRLIYRGQDIELEKKIEWYIPLQGSEVYLPPIRGVTGHVAEIFHILGSYPIVEINPDSTTDQKELDRLVTHLIEQRDWKFH